MKKGAGLMAVWLVFLVPLALNVNRGSGAPAAPNCGNCDCAEAQAWGWKDQSGYAEILATWDPNNPGAVGNVVTTAKERNNVVPICVAAKDCLKDNYTLLTDAWYAKWTYNNIAWATGCTITSANSCYYTWVPRRANAS